MPPQYRDIFAFVARLIAIYGVWYVAYDLWLSPAGQIEDALGAGFAAVIARFLNHFGIEALHAERVVWVVGSNGIEIVDDCIRVKMIGLFAGLVLAYPGDNRMRLWFIPAGVLLIFAVNFWRLTSLAIIQHAAPSLFDIAHYDVLPFVYHATIFGLWILWIHLQRGAPAHVHA